jgi:hypothetical protein
MSEANVRRLVGKLSQMRGAALKLGQFMSIQGKRHSRCASLEAELTGDRGSDTNMLPEQLERVLQQVQANADYMPDWQLEVCPIASHPLLITAESFVVCSASNAGRVRRRLGIAFHDISPSTNGCCIDRTSTSSGAQIDRAGGRGQSTIPRYSQLDHIRLEQHLATITDVCDPTTRPLPEQYYIGIPKRTGRRMRLYPRSG